MWIPRPVSLCVPAILLLASPGVPSVAIAQVVVIGDETITVTGQVRPRFEFRDSAATDTDGSTSMRVRAGLDVRLEDGVGAFIQLQDVRLWGSETSTLGDFSADHFDLHQGYIEIRSRGAATLGARVGRQEVRLGGERLIGAVNWTQQGRSFDGVRLSADADRVRLDLIGAVLGDGSAPADQNDAALLGAYGLIRRAGPGDLDLYGLYNRVDGDPETDQVTLGGRWAGSSGPFRFRAEGTYQAGQRAGADVAAFLLGARAGAVLGRTATVTLWYDHLSGDDDPDDDELRVFDTLFATNHKFYGFADYFTNIPAHTAGRGLRDAAIKTSFKLHEDLTAALDVHSFYVTESAGLSTDHLGVELDLIATYRYSRHLGIQGGFSYLAAGDAFAEIGRFVDDAAWVYAMMDLSF